MQVNNKNQFNLLTAIGPGMVIIGRTLPIMNRDGAGDPNVPISGCNMAGGGSTLRLPGKIWGKSFPWRAFFIRCIAMENSLWSIRPSLFRSARLLKPHSNPSWFKSSRLGLASFWRIVIITSFWHDKNRHVKNTCQKSLFKDCQKITLTRENCKSDKMTSIYTNKLKVCLYNWNQLPTILINFKYVNLKWQG